MLSIADLGDYITCATPHADDVTWNAGGTLAEAIRAGAYVSNVVISDNDGGSPDPRWPDIVPIRQDEEKDSGKRIGVHRLRFLGEPEGLMTQRSEQIIQRLTEIFIEEDPTSVVTYDPWGLTGHPLHRDGNTFVAVALRRAQCSALMLQIAPNQHWLTTVMPQLDELARAIWDRELLKAVPDSRLALDLRLDGAELDDKVAAVCSHASQIIPLSEKLQSVGGLEFLINNWFNRESFTVCQPWRPLR